MGIDKTKKLAVAGFTIVELLIVIVVIGILAAIVIVAYNGVQQRAGEVTVKSDLANAAKAMETDYAVNGTAYAAVLPATVKTSPGVELRLIRETGGYSGLTPVQIGVLFRDICQSLVTAGEGSGTNIVGGVEQYITSCSVYGYNSLHINGWHSNHFATPVSAAGIGSWYSANAGFDAWRPNKQAVYQTFAQKLSEQMQALAGTTVATTFWDPWASPGNGVMIQNLPPPNPPSDPTTFCIEATHTRYSGIQLYVRNGGSPTAGTCPAL